APLADLLSEIDATLTRFLAGERTPMSWANMLGGNAIDLPQQVVFTVQPHLDYGNLLPATDAIGALRARVAEFGYDDHPDVSVRLTGGAALGYDELRSVVRGAERAAMLALVLVAACLIIGLRSLSLVIATLLALVVGLVLTASFATLAVGTLNMISVAFAVLYVGLGVDFAIHLCLRYRELAGARLQEAAMLAAARHVGVSLALCALTTAIAFFAFIPTSYRGVAELGLISGVGIIIGLVVSLTLLPAVLRALPAPRPPRRSASARLLQTTGRMRNKHILIVAAICAIAALFALPYARFDHNPLHLNDPFAESITTLQDLDDDDSMDFIAAIAPDQGAAATLSARLTALPTVAEVITIDDLVPEAQDEKLALIDDMRFTLGDVLEPAAPTPLSPGVAGPALVELALAIDDIPPDHALAATFTSLGATVQRLRAMLDGLPTAAALEQQVALERMLMHHFPDQLERLRRGLEAERITQDALPEPLLRRWVTEGGRYRLEIRPRDDTGSSQALARFVDEVRGVLGASVTGTPVINIEAGRAVTVAFYEAFAAAGVLITALLFCVLRRLREVAVVLTPLLLAGLLTTAINIALGIPFNFANIIALPLLLGIGVDSALHILHRYKTTGQDDAPLLATSSARAVLFSALTSAASFGNLAVSDHAGTASMGIMLTVGLSMTLLCTLVVLPALLRHFVEVSGSLTSRAQPGLHGRPPD
ncbi:MAG: MMPL family transporter, partial [Gammaproteobacteria bacterium]